MGLVGIIRVTLLLRYDPLHIHEHIHLHLHLHIRMHTQIHTHLTHKDIQILSIDILKSFLFFFSPTLSPLSSFSL